MPGGDSLDPLVRVTREGDEDFPSALRGLEGAPRLLYWIGSRWPPPARAVAVVGSRAATPYGLEMAWQLATDLARAGVSVVSGMARGIDQAAHEGALTAGGVTVAVLAARPETAYPPQSHDLHSRVLAAGAVCSPFPRGVAPRPSLFLTRNRVVAGLARGVIVVEAGPRSGAHTTASWARRWGRFVAAVPGDVTRESSLGTLALLRQGAVAVGDAGHVLAEMDRGAGDGEDAASRLRAALGPRPQSPAALARRAGMSEREARAELVLLELSGAVERRAGGRYARRREGKGG
jgi:DNA processing protein